MKFILAAALAAFAAADADPFADLGYVLDGTTIYMDLVGKANLD